MQYVRKAWELLREMTGDAAYERYRQHLRARHPDRRPLSPREFYLARLNEKYSRPSRCC